MYNCEYYLLMPSISSGGWLLEGDGGTPQTSAVWSVPTDDIFTMQVRARFKPADYLGGYRESR